MTMQPQACDLVIRNGVVITMDSERTVYETGAVAIQGHDIAAVGREAEVLSKWSSEQMLDAKGAYVHPGYVDAHLHVNAQTCRGFFRGDASKGSSSGPNYADWKAALTPEDENAAAALASIEMLRHGITAFVEPGSAFDPEAVAQATSEVGVRCSLADPYLWDDMSLLEVIPGLKSDSLARRVPPNRDRCLKLMGGQLFRNRDRGSILHGHVALYGEGTASDELFRAAKVLADREGVILNSHIGFDLDLAEAMEQHWGKPRFTHLAEIGVLGPNATFVHMNLVGDEEIAPIVSSGMSIIWCPLAYMTRGTPLRRPTRIPELFKKGVPVGLGTDSARQSSAGDAGFLALQLSGEISAPTVAEDILEMLTIGSARAAGLQDLVGSLQPGKRADIVIRSARVAELMPAIDPAHQLVAVGHGATADTVLVNGRLVLRDGRPTQVDEANVFARVRRSVTNLVERLGLGSSSPWPLAA
jgi:5-methylthioadenosine/S-adenosylhomocysteine deaminase